MNRPAQCRAPRPQWFRYGRRWTGWPPRQSGHSADGPRSGRFDGQEGIEAHGSPRPGGGGDVDHDAAVPTDGAETDRVRLTVRSGTKSAAARCLGLIACLIAGCDGWRGFRSQDEVSQKAPTLGAAAKQQYKTTQHDLTKSHRRACLGVSYPLAAVQVRYCPT